MRIECPKAWLFIVCVLLAACQQAPPQAYGTLEYERITLPAPVSEQVTAIHVREGERVEAGAVLLRLQSTTVEATTEAMSANAARQHSALDELRAGPRSESIAQARAQLAQAQASASQARRNYERLEPLGRQQLVAANDVDAAHATMQAAQAQVRVASEALDTLLHGTRIEQIDQGRAAADAADAQLRAQQLLLDKLSLTAPRQGRIDSLPYKLGDQPPVGAPLVVMLVGDAPHARVYVSQALRTQVRVGDPALVHIEGRNQAYSGTVRMIRSEPVYTPYFALTGSDAERLSYLAEIQLGTDATELPAGLPVRASFGSLTSEASQVK